MGSSLSSSSSIAQLVNESSDNDGQVKSFGGCHISCQLLCSGLLIGTAHECRRRRQDPDGRLLRIAVSLQPALHQQPVGTNLCQVWQILGRQDEFIWQRQDSDRSAEY